TQRHPREHAERLLEEVGSLLGDHVGRQEMRMRCASSERSTTWPPCFRARSRYGSLREAGGGRSGPRELKDNLVAASSNSGSMVATIAAMQDYDRYRDLAWEGSFEQYLQIVKQRPEVTRNAFQRMYDMVLSHGSEEYVDNKKKIVRYGFFSDPLGGGKDAVYGLDIPLMRLVNVLKAAAN